MRRIRALSALVLALPLLTFTRAAAAAPVWVGDFETGDTSQWSGVLNGEVGGVPYVNVVNDPVARGGWAARIELHDDAVWPNGLKRVELNHRPEPGRTAEGATTFFAWSFLVPRTLPSDPSQQIAYWESDSSYQQMMAFEVDGEHITFSTRQPNNIVQWDQDGVVTAATWHRIAMRIVWSKDPALGVVDVWFDGQQVVAGAGAKTLADDNPHFTQIGLLRGAIDFADVPVIVIDDAAEGDSLEDVHFDALPGGGEESGTAGSTGGGDETAGGATGSGESGMPGTSSPGGSTAAEGSGGGSDAGDSSGASTSSESTGSTAGSERGGSGCGCATDRSPVSRAWLGLAVIATVARRRRSR
jgi:MYXO-CTERM domain-containing protein